jgi:hypothetical protein
MLQGSNNSVLSVGLNILINLETEQLRVIVQGSNNSVLSVGLNILINLETEQLRVIV